jgi:hypothetical protein
VHYKSKGEMMLKDLQKRERFALSLIQAGLDSNLVCKAASLSQYQYSKLQKHFHSNTIQKL